MSSVQQLVPALPVSISKPEGGRYGFQRGDTHPLSLQLIFGVLPLSEPCHYQ